MIVFGILFVAISLFGLNNAGNMAMFIRDTNDYKEIKEEKNWSLGLMLLGLLLITLPLLLDNNYMVY